MRFHQKTKKTGAAAAEITALPYPEWRLGSLAMVQELEREPAMGTTVGIDAT